MRFVEREESSPMTVRVAPENGTAQRTAPLPPTPKGRFLVANAREWVENPLNFLLKCAREYGDVTRLRLINQQVYILNHPDAIKDVLVNNSAAFPKVVSPRNLIRVLAGNALMGLEGDFWRRQRRLVQPAFHRARINAYGNIMVSYTERMLATWQNGETRDIRDEMMRLTLEIVVKALFDADATGAIKDVSDMIETASQQSQTWGLLSDTTYENTDIWQTTAVQNLDNMVFDIIRERRASGEDRGDLLSMLLHAQDEDNTSMSDQQLRDEIIGLFLAGHETTANTLSWLWYLLAQHPEVEARMLAELDEVLGGRAPTVADLAQLHYTEMVLQETLRLFPPIWFMSREAAHDTEIMGYHVPAGTSMVLCPWVMHRDPRYYDNPEAFIPERWDGDLPKQLPRFAYFPFGGGHRLCLGQSFASMEVVLLVATIAPKFRLNLVPGHPVITQPLVTLRPRHGIKVTLAKR
jgi:cytochrome P450